MWTPKFLASETSSQLPALGRDKRMWMSSRQMGLQQEAFSLSPGRWAGEGVREGEWGEQHFAVRESTKKTLSWLFIERARFPCFPAHFEHHSLRGSFLLKSFIPGCWEVSRVLLPDRILPHSGTAASSRPAQLTTCWVLLLSSWLQKLFCVVSSYTLNTRHLKVCKDDLKK